MDLGIPTDLIRQVQLSLRKEAGLSAYDPTDPALLGLRSLRELVAGFDPLPPSLRCEHCQGRLLRGLQSMICAYCGRLQSKDVPSEPVTFQSTFGYQWLLQSLDLNGSETLGPSIQEHESNRLQRPSQDEISLADLLNLQILWPAELEKTENRLTGNAQVQSKSSSYFTGIHLDNFFGESKSDLVSNQSEEPPTTDKQIENVEMNAFSSQENLSLFQNVQHSATAVSYSGVKDEASFTGWEADFQSASSGNYHEASRPLDPFLGSAVDLSAQMDSVFGPDKKLGDNPKDTSTPLALATNEWIQDELWNSSTCLGSQQAEQDGATIKSKDGVAADNLQYHSSISDDWFSDDPWQTSNKPTPDDQRIHENDDSFDVWNDFTSSTIAQDPSNNPSAQSTYQVAALGQTSDVYFSSSTKDFQEMDFGSFSQLDIFSGSVDNRNGSFEADNIHPEVPGTDRMDNVNVGGGNVGQADGEGDIFNSASQSEHDVESLLSQMHDLSFMLKSDLSVPSK
ncbi:hypothetical protein NMG60_11035408 [Bertholletia excelsa]